MAAMGDSATEHGRLVLPALTAAFALAAVLAATRPRPDRRARASPATVAAGVRRHEPGNTDAQRLRLRRGFQGTTSKDR
jgi:hypothetical protein